MSLVKPSVTPTRALFARARAKPWKAARLSSFLSATRVPSSCLKVTPFGIGAYKVPFGPLNSTFDALIVTVTPDGIDIGFFPTLDIIFLILDLGFSIFDDQGTPSGNLNSKI